jgi:peptide/nickel transport system ATP-binding protein
VSAPLLQVDGLVLRAGERTLADGVGFTVAAGETVGLVGPSGSGKTSVALAVLGHCREGVAHAGGAVLLDGRPMLPAPPPGMRGTVVGYVGQDPGAALNPFRTVGKSVASAGARDVGAALERLGLPAALARRYPHQLSGGQQQRVALAIALARRPRLLVLDEPTSGLDLLATAEVTAELLRLRSTGTALLWVGHDLTTLSGAADRLLVLAGGRLVEHGPTDEVLARPQSTTGRALVDARRRLQPGGRQAGGAGGVGKQSHFHATSLHESGSVFPGEPPPCFAAAVAPRKCVWAATPQAVLATCGLAARYPGGPPVLRGVDLEIRAGEILAVLGVSGVGKTTLARCLAGLHPPEAGTVLLDGTQLAADVRRRSRAERAAIQLVAQNPAEALHPRQTVHTALARPLRLLQGISRAAEVHAEVGRLLEAVGLERDQASALPAELSGGQRQRAALARALAAQPRVLVCDEVTSALDTVSQTAVLELVRGLGLAVVLITHDPAVAAGVADRVLVLADGRVAIEGPVAAVLPPPDPAAALLRRLGAADDRADVG